MVSPGIKAAAGAQLTQLRRKPRLEGEADLMATMLAQGTVLGRHYAFTAGHLIEALDNLPRDRY
jgi:hypothetical protein